MKWLALHGVPAGPQTWERLNLPLRAHRFQGIASDVPRADWSLESFVDEILPLVDRNTVLLGHDLGGVVAAMCAIETPVRAVVLTGTALGPWWIWTRMATWPGLRLFFYRRYGGSLFLKKGVTPASQSAFTASFASALEIPNLSDRMLALAQCMKPPPRLAFKLRSRCPVHIVWGQADVWYPPIVARGISRSTRSPIHWVEGGHYCMWENPAEFEAALRSIEETIGSP